MSKYQDQFRAVMTELETFRAKDTLTPEESEAFKGKLELAETLKAHIEREQAADALKMWQAQSAGSIVKSTAGLEQTSDNGDVYVGFSGEAVKGGDGIMPGVSMTPVSYRWDIATRSHVVSGGDLVPATKSGERLIALMKSGEYKDAYNAYLRSAAKGTQPAAKHMKVLMEGADQSGGFWVPPDMRTQIVQKQATVMSVGNYVNRFQASSDVVSFPASPYTTDDKYTSGVRFSWTAEAPASAVSEASNPLAGRINIPVHTATCALVLTRELLEDAAFDVLGFCSDKIGEAYGLGINDAYINGDGAGKPQGILNHPLAGTAHASGGMLILSGAAGAVAWGNATTGLIGTETALPPQYESGAAWYANKATYAAIRSINVGTATMPQWSLSDSWPNFGNGYQPTLLGYPTRRDQFMPAVGASATPIMLGDLSAYYAPMRTGLTIEVFREILGLRGMVVLYARQRLGGQLVEPWRVKLMKSNNS